MTPIRQSGTGRKHGTNCPQRRSTSYQKHNQQLILNRLGRFDPGQDLPRHHSGQVNQAGCRHRIYGGHHAAAERVARHRQHRLMPGRTETKLSFDSRTFAYQAGCQRL